MDPLIELLDKYKKACSLASDKAAAESLGLSRQSAHRWRHGGGIDDDHIAEMADAIGERSEVWMVKIRQARAGKAARRGWERAAAAITHVAAAVVLSVALTWNPARASAHESSRITPAHCLLCQIVEGGSGRLSRCRHVAPQLTVSPHQLTMSFRLTVSPFSWIELS